MAKWMPLVTAARVLRMSWHRAWRLAVAGDLEAEQRDGKWYATSASVEHYARHGHANANLTEAVEALRGGK